MTTITVGKHNFEIVNRIPYGYVIWNIGKNMRDDYLPLVQVGGYDGCQVNPNTMKAIQVKDAQKILVGITRGQGSVMEMEAYIEKHRYSNVDTTKIHVKRLEEAVKVMRQIDGIQDLDEWMNRNIDKC